MARYMVMPKPIMATKSPLSAAHLHLAELVIAPESDARSLSNALINALQETAQALNCQRLTVSMAG